jgi:hypothetical protein
MRPHELRQRFVIASVIATLTLSSFAVGPALSLEGSPAIVELEWHEREGTTSDPLLNLTLTFDAPSGLVSGEVQLGSVWHEILTTASLGAYGPGRHAVDVSVAPPGDKPRPWEVIGLTLAGADGQSTTYGFCELTSLVETREKPSRPRLSADCLDGPGWVVYTFRVEEAPSGILWMQGVATRDNTYAGAGHVLQDASGQVITWGTALAVDYPQARDGTRVRVAGNTLVNEPSPDPSAQPGPHRIVLGVGGSVPATLTPGEVYRWAAYYAVRPGHFDLPFISLEAEGLKVLSVERGSSAGIAWGDDFDPSIVVQRSDADAAVFADGQLNRSFQRSTTCMFGFVGEGVGGFFGGNASRIEGPSAPPVGGVVVAGKPGDYRFLVHAAAGASWSQHVVAYADMPLTPQ